jgi:hypothetical protein
MPTSTPGTATPAATPPIGGKLALLIGNTNYGGDPVSGIVDSQALLQALNGLGFIVTPLQDGTLAKTTATLDSFKTSLLAIKPSVVVISWTGHGFQLNGQSYLQPVDGSVDPNSSLPLETLLQTFGAAPEGAVKLAFLNVCRSTVDLSAPSPQTPPNDSVPAGVVQSFAATPGQNAVSGVLGALSPYAAVLVKHIREAGLTVAGLLDKLTQEVPQISPSQTPTFVGDPPAGFCLQPAVQVLAKVTDADDGLIMVLNDTIAFNQQGPASKPVTLTLNAGANKFTLLVFNQRTFVDSQSWSTPEGWSYSLSLLGPDGTELTASQCQQSPCYKDGEPVPFKAGPHHGGVFHVATGNLVVDPVSAALTLQDVDTKVWQTDPPVWAQDQDLLYDAALSSLPLGQINVPGTGLSVQALLQLLQNLNLPALNLPDLTTLHACVRGNTAFKAWVQTCMVAQQADRIADLQTSLGAAVGGNPTPFASFDASLTAAVQAVAAADPTNTLTPDQISVYTDLEDRSPTPQTSTTP